jgi:hypothetical protein
MLQSRYTIAWVVWQQRGNQSVLQTALSTVSNTLALTHWCSVVVLLQGDIATFL